MNKWRERSRRKGIPIVDAGDTELANISDDADSESFWDHEYKQQLVTRAIDLIRSEFSPKTYDACRDLVFGDLSVEEAAIKHGISIWTLYSARSRMLKRLRDRLDGMID